MITLEINFKWYKPSIGTPIISIAEYGITFNKAAAEEMNNPPRIQLGFDEFNLLIGVKPVHIVEEDSDKTSLIFAERERNGFIRVNNKDFIRFISRYCPDIKFDRAVRCLGKWDEDLQVLIIDLKHPIEGQSSEDQEIE